MRRFMQWILAVALLLGAVPAEARTPLAATPISRVDLSWWRERHEAKLAELRQKQPRLIFLGDSITQQWEHAGPPDFQNYAPSWQRFYGDRGAVNLGFTGDATAHLLWRIRNGEVAGITPKVAVVLIGANNLGRLHWSAEDTIAGIDAIVAELRHRLPSTRIVLLGILPSDRSPWATATTLTVNKALAARFPTGGEVTFLDLTHIFMKDGRLNLDMYSDPRLTPPGPPLHPSASGQLKLAEALEPTLAGLLGDRPHK